MSDDRLEKLLKERRYADLRAALATSSLSSSDRAYYGGVLANRENRITDSIRLLRGVLPQLQRPGDAPHLRIALRALADDYVKSFQYAAAVEVFRRIDQQFGPHMHPADRNDTRNTILLFSVIRNIPPQRVEPGGAFSLPITTNPLGLPTIPVNAGNADEPWILDTGANLSTITDSTARRLKMELSQQTITVDSINGGQVRAHLAAAKALRIGPALIRNTVFLVLKDKDLYIAPRKYQIDAILGFPVLSALGRLTFAREGRLRIDPFPQNAVPDRSSNLFLEDMTPLTLARLGGEDRLFMLDTGARSSFLTIRYYKENAGAFRSQKPTEFHMGGAGGIKALRGVTLPRLSLEFAGGKNATLASAQVLAVPLGEPQDSFYGNLGQDVLLQFPTYTLDFRSMRLSFSG